MRTLSVIPWIALAASSFGCGPVASSAQVLKTNVALSAAETAGAKENAPYEYNTAVEYMKKAREEAGYSDFRASERFASKALDFAERARRKAEATAHATQPPALPPP